MVEISADGSGQVLEIQPPAALTALKPDSRWQVLAGLRFLLAMVVVAGHLTWFEQKPPVQPLLPLLGTSAVLGFLIISGYSIAHSLQRRPIGFFQRRVLRIYPLYFTAVLYALIPYVSGADALAAPSNVFDRPHAWVVIGNLLMLQNLICPAIESNMLVWTLGIEVACYLMAPQLRRMPTAVLAVLIAISAAAFAFLYPSLWGKEHRHYVKLLWGLPLLMFAWAWIAGMVMHRFKNAWPTCVAIIAVSIFALKFNPVWNPPASIWFLVGVIILIAIAPYIRLPMRIGRCLEYLGDLSYPIYLFHLPTFVIGYCVMDVMDPYGLLAMALAISNAFLFIESIFKPLISRSWNRNRVPTAG